MELVFEDNNNLPSENFNFSTQIACILRPSNCTKHTHVTIISSLWFLASVPNYAERRQILSWWASTVWCSITYWFDMCVFWHKKYTFFRFNTPQCYHKERLKKGTHPMSLWGVGIIEISISIMPWKILAHFSILETCPTLRVMTSRDCAQMQNTRPLRLQAKATPVFLTPPLWCNIS